MLSYGLCAQELSCGGSGGEGPLLVDVPAAQVFSSEVRQVAPARSATPEEAHPIAWIAYEPDVQARAREARRPLLVYAFAEWCAPCREIERRVLTDAAVERAAEGFLAVRLDLTNADEPLAMQAAEAFQIEKMPTILLVDPVTGARAEAESVFDAPRLAAQMRRFRRAP